VSTAALSSFLFDPLRRWLDQLPPQPDAVALAELAGRHPIGGPNGIPVRFVPPQADGLAYECRVWETGEVETRPGNWHDFFNGLVWLTFPQTKRAITAAHVAAMQSAGAARGSTRDALTHFDECGIAVLSSRPELLDLLRGFEWKKLFVDRRADVRVAMRFVIVGHATYEALYCSKLVKHGCCSRWQASLPRSTPCWRPNWPAAATSCRATSSRCRCWAFPA
jgi:Protein of unknown function (DUF3025)